MINRLKHKQPLKASENQEYSLRLIIFTLSILACTSSYCSADISIVVNIENYNDIPQSYLKKLFLGQRKSFPDGRAAQPLVHEENSEIANHFNLLLLNRNLQQYKSYWARIIFTGKGHPPEEIYNDQEMIARISRNSNAIGYINSSSLNSSVREIYRIKKPFVKNPS